ncbi:MAG: hypothetical protein LBP72_01240 [Dysgonamonadaceae bacterium]|nr:hypothetical protein [Dysgonamonadaceae bacterium]
MKQLEAKERLMIFERLMQYTLPKQQSISIEAQIQAEYGTLEKLLSNGNKRDYRARNKVKPIKQTDR